MTTTMTSHQARQWWDEKTAGMEHFATADTTLAPHTLDLDFVGHHVSLVFESGTRTYAFTTQKFRDRFVNKYRAHGTKQIGKPFG